MSISVEIINNSPFTLPEYQTMGSAGIDLKANTVEKIELKPLERKLIPTGLFMAIPEGYEGQVRARSGLSLKKGLTMVNGIGTVDSDYRGEILVPLVNLSDQVQTIDHGERIAQIVFSRFEKAEFNPVQTLGETSRGEGGFGSTKQF